MTGNNAEFQLAERKKMNIVIVSSDRYPDGGASANRHLAYAKGLVELGNSVTFILLAPQKNARSSYFEDGINFRCVFSYNIFFKLIRNHSSLVPVPSIKKGKRLIHDINSVDNIDIVILLDTHIWMLNPFLNLCKRIKIKVIHERTEYPLVAIKRGVFGRLHHYFYSRKTLPRFDGIFVINNALKKYFIKLTRKRIPVAIINMMVDPSRFNLKESTKIDNGKYIAYCGSMDIKKDGLDILIRSFGKAIEDLGGYDDLKLMLIGDNTDKILKDKLNKVITESNCRDRIVFTGAVLRHEIPDLLNNAQALALARPYSLQAEGGFPTKLGEYLSTGKPVIITDTGEIGLYLKDGHNAFIAEPGSVNSFSDKIKEVFSNYTKAMEISSRGKDLVFTEFNYLNEARKLADFIKTTIKSGFKEKSD